MHGTVEKKFIPRRSRTRKRATTGKVGISDADIHGLFEPVTRYGRLPTNHLIQFDTRYPHYREKRLTKLFHETEKWKPKDLPLIRYVDAEHWSINSQSLWMHGPGAFKFLGTSPELRSVIEKSIIGPLPDPHDIGLCIHTARIELAVKAAKLPFYSHVDILKDEGALAAYESDDPRAIPLLDGIAWNMTGGYVQTPQTALVPDALFGIGYPQGVRFFAVEFDRGTETEIPKRDLKRRSWLRKVLCYRAAWKGQFAKHLGIPNPVCLIIAPSEERRQGILRAIKHVYTAGSDMFAVAVAEPVKVFKHIPPPDDHLFTTEWQRVGHPPLVLSRA